MRIFDFDFLGILSGIFFFFTTCNTSSPVEVTNLDLSLPNNSKETTMDYSEVTSKLTLILLGDNIYAYEGRDITKGKVVQEQNLLATIQSAKRNFSTSEFVVIIKPSANATYQHTVDLLDEMAKNKIDRYTLEDLSKEEMNFLQINNLAAPKQKEKH